MLVVQRIIEFFYRLVFTESSVDFSHGQIAAQGGFYTIVIASVAIGMFTLVIKLISRIKSLAFI